MQTRTDVFLLGVFLLGVFLLEASTAVSRGWQPPAARSVSSSETVKQCLHPLLHYVLACACDRVYSVDMLARMLRRGGVARASASNAAAGHHLPLDLLLPHHLPLDLHTLAAMPRWRMCNTTLS